ncbi:RICIN domain-containing protein [Amycolatopsis sp. NPDC059021]|uniref:RICIN domain-containing protein n=1 Tax=Amycolatopsis sp. NPDC059021 TaxID=3346704 RepID=UPI00367052C8
MLPTISLRTKRSSTIRRTRLLFAAAAIFGATAAGVVPAQAAPAANSIPNPASGHNISDRVDTDGVTYTRTLTPTLTFRPTDPDGGPLTAVFYVYDRDTMIADNWVWNVPSGSIAQWTVPAGLLQQGHTYRFRATTFDAENALADDAWVNLQSVYSGQMADVAACGVGNGTRVQQWPANGADCQKFFPWGTGDGYYQFQAKHSGQVLDNTNCRVDNGNPVTMYDKVNGDCQKWTVEPQGMGSGVYKFAVRNPGKVLDQGCSTRAGTILMIWDRLGGDTCQEWRMPTSPANGVTVQWLQFTVNLNPPLPKR